MHSDVEILTILGCRFIKECFDFQALCMKEFIGDQSENMIKSSDTPYLHPFGQPFITLSGYIYGTWRHFELRNYKIYAVADEKGHKTINIYKIIVPK